MKKVVITLLILSCVIALTGCQGHYGSPNGAPATNPDDPLAPDRPAVPHSEVLKITGTVVYMDLEGGFFAIDGDDGQKYSPIDLPEAFKKDGLHVKVSARTNPDAMGIHMYGTIIEIVDITAD